MYSSVRTFTHVQTVIEARAVIRGDLQHISIGRSCIVGEGVVLRPPLSLLGCAIVCGLRALLDLACNVSSS
jgi:carbonic anhydrase/acetyltransferase-like protein (isoleucine patch superfamily)